VASCIAISTLWYHQPWQLWQWYFFPGVHQPCIQRYGSWLTLRVDCCLQVVLGIATFRLHLQVEPLTVTHQAVGAALLGSLVAFTVLALRDQAQSRGVNAYCPYYCHAARYH